MKPPRNVRFAAICIIAFFAQAAFAAYPERPVRLLVPSSSGSGPDAIARLVAARMGTLLSQQIVCDNRAGANGVIASELVARAAPDGYTLLMTSGGHTTNPHMYRKLPYDPIADFTPITQFITSGGLVVVVTPSFGARTIAQLIEMARAAPGKIVYASAGVGNSTHLAGEMFNQAAGVRLTHVPYKGGAPAMQDLLGERVAAYFSTYSTAKAYIENGKLIPLAVTGPQRLKALPKVQTIAESGYPGFNATNWYAFVASSRVPASIMDRWNLEIVKVLKSPDVVSQLNDHGLTPMPTSREDLAKYMAKESATWGRLIKEKKITGE